MDITFTRIDGGVGAPLGYLTSAVGCGIKNPAEAQLLLGMAQLKAGNKPEAVKAFKEVKGDEVTTRLGNLWALHAQQ